MPHKYHKEEWTSATIPSGIPKEKPPPEKPEEGYDVRREHAVSGIRLYHCHPRRLQPAPEWTLPNRNPFEPDLHGNRADCCTHGLTVR